MLISHCCGVIYIHVCKYQITSTSAKLTALKRHFHDLSENVHMSVVYIKCKNLWHLKEFTRCTKWCDVQHTHWSGTQGVKY